MTVPDGTRISLGEKSQKKGGGRKTLVAGLPTTTKLEKKDS